MNIFDNCIKYGAFGSTIEINQWIQAGTDMAVITVRGQSRYPLSSEDIAQICELGFRGSNAKKTIASGTGLGLYIVRKIVEYDHAGIFHIQADTSDGILFTIKLPRGERG